VNAYIEVVGWLHLLRIIRHECRTSLLMDMDRSDEADRTVGRCSL